VADVMKNKSQYEKELEYQIDLMRALDSQCAERELAISLVEYGRLIAAGELSRAEKDSLVSEIILLAAEIEQDEDRLEYFKWVYMVAVSKENITQDAAEAVRGLCEARFPFLSDYLTVSMEEIQEKLNEIRGRSPDTMRNSDAV
jgi:hypothetical protein